MIAHYDSQGQACSCTQLRLPDYGGEEEDIPTIVLKPESAIHTLDMFLDAYSSSSSSSSLGSSNAFSASASTGSSVPTSSSSIRVLDADYNALSQTLLYSCDESKTHYGRKRRRAAYISATVIKESADVKLGMGIQKVRGSLLVSSLRPGCLLSDSPLQVGDKLVSINNTCCSKKSVSGAALLLKNATGFLTIVVEDPNGDPKLVESMVMKSTKGSKVGLGVAPSSAARELKVSSINPTGIFAESLLNRRDRILSINNTLCDYLDVGEAAKLITTADKTVTVVAERKSDSAAVVALG